MGPAVVRVIDGEFYFHALNFLPVAEESVFINEVFGRSCAESADDGFEVFYSVDERQEQGPDWSKADTSADDVNVFVDEFIDGVAVAVRASERDFLAFLSFVVEHAGYTAGFHDGEVEFVGDCRGRRGSKRRFTLAGKGEFSELPCLECKVLFGDDYKGLNCGRFVDYFDDFSVNRLVRVLVHFLLFNSSFSFLRISRSSISPAQASIHLPQPTHICIPYLSRK